MTIIEGLTFVVPAKNEQAVVKKTLLNLTQVLSKLDIPTEVILVDDGSDDNTRSIAESVPGVKVLHHAMCLGYGNSLKHAICEARYPWIGIIDADGTYPPDEIPELLIKSREGFDMVVGSRTNIRDLDTRTKNFMRVLLKLLVHLLYDRRIDDPNSGFRIFRKDIVIPLMPFLCGTFSFTTSLTILLSGLGYSYTYVPVQYRQRIGTSKVLHFRDSLRTFQYIVQGITFFNPIKFYLILGLLDILLGFGPTLVIYYFGFPFIALISLVCANTIIALFGLAGLADIVRISAVQRNLRLGKYDFMDS